MSKYIIGRTAAVLIAMFVVATACKGRDEALDRDLGLVGESASGNIDLKDDAGKATGKTGGNSSGNTSGGGTSRSTGSTSGSTAARTGTIATGTALRLASNERICTNTHKARDTFTATVSESVTGSNGAVIPAGATANVVITSLSRKSNVSDRVEMGILVQSLRINGKTYPIDSRVTNVQVNTQRSAGNKDAQKVIGGAVVGAVVGQIIGKDTKSTVIGAATGAAAGTAVAMATGDYDGCIPANGNISISLNSPVTITVVQ